MNRMLSSRQGLGPAVPGRSSEETSGGLEVDGMDDKENRRILAVATISFLLGALTRVAVELL